MVVIERCVGIAGALPWTAEHNLETLEQSRDCRSRACPWKGGVQQVDVVTAVGAWGRSKRRLATTRLVRGASVACAGEGDGRSMAMAGREVAGKFVCCTKGLSNGPKPSLVLSAGKFVRWVARCPIC